MAKYQIRFFFDPGSGICFWSANKETRKVFDYPIDLGKLNLNENTSRGFQYLIAWFDTSIDWDNPAHSRPWPQEEFTRFDAYKNSLLQKAKEELGSDFDIIDESDANRHGA